MNSNRNLVPLANKLIRNKEKYKTVEHLPKMEFKLVTILYKSEEKNLEQKGFSRMFKLKRDTKMRMYHNRGEEVELLNQNTNDEIYTKHIQPKTKN